MRHHRIAKRLLATALLAGGLFVGPAVATSSATSAPPAPLLLLTRSPPPPGFCDVTFCFVLRTGGFSLGGALQAPLSPPVTLKLAAS